MTRWRLRMAASAEKSLTRLPEKAATALVEFIVGPLLDDPCRLGKPLRNELAGRWSARRGPYRVIYELDEAELTVRVLYVDHRADAYRSSRRPS